MTTTTSYGTWANHGGGDTTIEDEVVAALGEFSADYDAPAIAIDYRAAINAGLPSGITLCGNEFYGPAPVADDAAETIDSAIQSVDFWAIAARREYTRPASRYWIAVPGDTAAVATYIRDTAAAAGADRENVDVDHDRSLIEFGQGVYDVLAALPSDADGHVTECGDLWFDGAEYVIGVL